MKQTKIKKYLNRGIWKDEKFNDFVNSKNKNMPKRLYKYSSLEKDNSTKQINIIESIKNDYMWMAKANTLNDPADSLKFMHQRNFQKELYERFQEVGIKNIKKKEIDIFNEKKMKDLKNRVEEKYGENSEQYNRINDIFRDESLARVSKKFLNDDRENTFIHSLSESYDFPLMWSYYANNHTGICVEYEIKEEKETLECTYPVYYAESPFYLNSFLHKAIKHQKKLNKKKESHIKESNILEKMDRRSVQDVIVKSLSWKHEKEWRLIKLNKNEKHQDRDLESDFRCITKQESSIKGFRQPTKSISSVYLGLNISKENKKIICDLAREKNIKVYQIIQKDSSFALITEKVNL